MNTFKRTFTAVVIFLALFISCKDSKPSENQITETPNDTATHQTELDAVATAPDPTLPDTVGLHKLKDAEARAYIVEMNRILSDIDKAIDDDAPDRMPALMGKLREHEQKQLTIQSALTEADRTLFKIYANKVADRLADVATRLENM